MLHPYRIMTCVLLIALPLLVSCHSGASGKVDGGGSSKLKCVVEHGDKPGNVYIFSVCDDHVCEVEFFVTSPDTPDTIKGSQQLPIHIKSTNANELVAILDISDTKHREITIRFLDPLDRDTIRGTLSSGAREPFSIIIRRMQSK